MRASRLRQRPTARRLHHTRQSVSTRELRNVSNRRHRARSSQPEDHDNRQATRTSRRARALLREGRLGGVGSAESAAREGVCRSGGSGSAARPSRRRRRTHRCRPGPAPVRRPPPDPAGSTATLPRRIADPTTECRRHPEGTGTPRSRTTRIRARRLAAAPQLPRRVPNTSTPRTDGEFDVTVVCRSDPRQASWHRALAENTDGASACS
jgi:hypothetical protein